MGVTYQNKTKQNITYILWFSLCPRNEFLNYCWKLLKLITGLPVPVPIPVPVSVHVQHGVHGVHGA